MHLWPPRPARTASIRRLRAALVDALGADCHGCGLYPGAMVDHDHQTGQVRGLLCAFCNRVMEECPHLTGCPGADYLLVPPAAGLRLVYPASQQWRPKEATRQRVIEQLGFDPFARGCTRPRRRWNGPCSRPGSHMRRLRWRRGHAGCQRARARAWWCVQPVEHDAAVLGRWPMLVLVDDRRCGCRRLVYHQLLRSWRTQPLTPLLAPEVTLM
ncbi:endonuclease domain-containing protein [Streptomyces sp. NPDC058145]|uniref:endonuclease domain-containing protein n=1 Tax=Streptomyces sp. NPDC058145 TaxID=3346356 RepID=UPI0036E22197